MRLLRQWFHWFRKRHRVTPDEVENMSTQELREILDTTVEVDVAELVQKELAFRKQFEEESSITASAG